MLYDLKHAWRSLFRSPTLTLTAVLTLALGIGANTAIFSVVYALLLKPLPFRDPDRLIYIHDTFPAVANASVSWTKFVALRDGTRTLDALAGTSSGIQTITGRGEPRRIVTPRVSGDFFKVLGVPPLAGRGFTPSDDVPNAAPVIVLTYGLWQRVFAGDPRIIGEALTTDGLQRTIIGVMPAGFLYPSNADAWIPLRMEPLQQKMNALRLIGRVRDGVTVEQAAQDLATVTAVFNRENGLRRGIRVYRLHDFLSQTNRQMLLVLQGAVLLVLLVACANVANMLLARSISRSREFAIRAAIGARPWRILRLLLTESVLLSAIGGGAGVLVASWLLRFFVALAPTGFSGVQVIAIDWHVMGFTVAVAVVTGLIFGLAPARRGFHVDANDGLRDAGARGASSGGARGASRVLVVAEIGLAIVLVVGAGLMVKSLLVLEAQDTGFRPDGLLTFQITLPEGRYNDDQIVRTLARILDDIRALPGVKSAGAINFLPLTSFGFNGPFSIAGRPSPGTPDRPPVIEYRMVTPGYFSAMGIPIRQGTEFTERDTRNSQPVVIINEAMARQYWPKESPIGATINLAVDGTTVARQIVAVVGDVRSASLGQPPVPESYIPHAQLAGDSMGIAVRTEGDPTASLPAIRQRIAAIDPDVPLVRAQPMIETVDASAGSLRLSSLLTSGFALLAAVLASIGIYSLVSYSVAQRTREIGIRVALGASPGSVMRLVVGEGLVLAGCGVALGLAGTFTLAGAVRSLLYHVSPADPLVLTGTCAAVAMVTAVASFVPALRVTHVDPTVALRAE